MRSIITIAAKVTGIAAILVIGGGTVANAATSIFTGEGSPTNPITETNDGVSFEPKNPGSCKGHQCPGGGSRFGNETNLIAGNPVDWVKKKAEEARQAAARQAAAQVEADRKASQRAIEAMGGHRTLSNQSTQQAVEASN